jgi:hypothetical protein
MFFGSLVPVDFLCFVSRLASMAMRLDRESDGWTCIQWVYRGWLLTLLTGATSAMVGLLWDSVVVVASVWVGDMSGRSAVATGVHVVQSKA